MNNAKPIMEEKQVRCYTYRANFTLEQTHEGPEEEQRYSSTRSLTSTLREDGQRDVPPALSPRMTR